jgi:NADPH:quinone reductase-like Zn-dependent oxidoreductase
MSGPKNTMKAYIYDSNVPDRGMRFEDDYPAPAAPAVGQVLISIRAASLNPVDFKLPKVNKRN